VSRVVPNFKNLNKLDLRNNLSLADEWIGNHSRIYGLGKSHAYDHVINPRNFGDEYYFSTKAFSSLTMH